MSSITIVGAGQKKGCYYYRPLFSLSLRAVVESGEKCAGWSGYRGAELLLDTIRLLCRQKTSEYHLSTSSVAGSFVWVRQLRL